MTILIPRKKKIERGALIGLLLAMAGGLVASPAVALNQAQQGYLDTIRQEMDSLGMDLVGADEQEGESGEGVGRGQSTGSEKASAQDQEAVAKQQFEQRLKDRSAGTFILYGYLNEEQQAQVIKEYTDTGDLARAKKKIRQMSR